LCGLLPTRTAVKVTTVRVRSLPFFRRKFAMTVAQMSVCARPPIPASAETSSVDEPAAAVTQEATVRRPTGGFSGERKRFAWFAPPENVNPFGEYER
jgi:hypothetical protein